MINKNQLIPNSNDVISNEDIIIALAIFFFVHIVPAMYYLYIVNKCCLFINRSQKQEQL